MSTEGSTKAIFAAFMANLGIAVAKFVAFLITGATSMLAESVHSAADTGNQALLILGKRRAARDADEAHNFGYGRERFFYAFVVALVLFSLGALFAIYEGVHKVSHPEPVESPLIAIGVLGIAIVLEGFSLKTAMSEARGTKGTQSWIQYIRRTKSPELPVVLLEDIGAMSGLAVALVAFVLAWRVDPVFDGYGSILIGVLLGLIAFVLAVEMKSLLIGEAADAEEIAKITAAIEATPEVQRLIHLRTEHLGPETILVAFKASFRPNVELGELSVTVDTIESSIRDALSLHAIIYVEPDVDRTQDIAQMP